MYPVQKQRPAGVTVLAILSFIQGIVAIVGGFLVAAVLASVGGGGPETAAFFAICSGVIILIGLIDFILGYGLWILAPWAWTVSVIFAILGLINFPIGTIISIIILIYLFKPEIKAVFGKGPPIAYPTPYGYPPPPYGPPPTGPAYQPPPAPPAPPQARTCKNCGASVAAGQMICPNCGSQLT